MSGGVRTRAFEALTSPGPPGGSGCRRGAVQGPRGAALAPRAPVLLHLHFASFQSVEVLRSTFAAMARGAQVRTPALLSAPPPPPPKPQLPLGAARRGCRRPGTPGGLRALLRVRVAPAEGPGQGRGTRSSCPAARSCARRPDTWLRRDMSGRRGAAPRPLGLYLRCWESVSLNRSGPAGVSTPAATGSELAGRAARNPERAAGHPGTCSPGRPTGPRTRIHTCAPARTRRAPGARDRAAPGASCFSEGRAAAWRPLRRSAPTFRACGAARHHQRGRGPPLPSAPLPAPARYRTRARRTPSRPPPPPVPQEPRSRRVPRR